MNITLTNEEIIIPLCCLAIIYLAFKFGDSEKSTAWMFFLGQIAFITLIVYWLIKLLIFIKLF
jgi:hypothetical protein